MTSAQTTPRRAARTERPAKGDLRERALLATAEKLLETGRFEQASVADLAEEAGISRATFYFYFASKQALLATVIDAAVSQFNAQIATVLDPRDTLDGERALRATVAAAADLWWDHRAVLVASFQLGATVPEVYERTMTNFEIVLAPTAALLERQGRVPESRDPEEAAGLVLALMLMSERTFFDLLRGPATRAQLDEVTRRLTRIWLRAFGFAG